MNSIALGFTRPEGREPLLQASTPPAPCMRAKASAIWLRLLFSMQTKRMRLVIEMVLQTLFGARSLFLFSCNLRAEHLVIDLAGSKERDGVHSANFVESDHAPKTFLEQQGVCLGHSD